MENPPYKPSWINRLIWWIEKLPAAYWVSYSVLTLVLAVTIFAIFYGHTDFEFFSWVVGAVYGVYSLAFFHVLYRVAVNSFEQFSASLEGTLEEIEALRWRLTVIPAWLGWLALGLTAILVSFEINLPDSQFYIGPEVPFFLIAFQFLFALFAECTLMLVIIYAFRQYRQIAAMHRMIEQIDLFDLEPLQAFSRLSSATAIGLLLFALLNQSPEFSSPNPLIDLYIFLLISFAALLLFLAPLLGLRNRLVKERDHQINLLMSELKSVTNKMREDMKRDQFEQLGDYKIGLDSLLIEKSELQKIQTWPWNPGTIRGFSSAFLLPVLIWVVTRLLERVF